MISVTRLNGKPIVINALLIESIEETPDTMMTLITGKKIMVLEKIDDVVSLVHRYIQAVGAVNSTIMSSNQEEL